jgi:two-component system NarL family sensor kinase
MSMSDPPNLRTEATRLRRGNRELAMLNRIAEALSRSVDLHEAVQTTLAYMADLLGLHTGWVWLLREGSDQSYLAAAQNLPPGLANYPQRMEGWCYCLDTFKRGDMAGAANVNIITCTRLKALVDDAEGLRYHASVPLYASRGEKLGVLNLASPDWRELSTDDLRLLHTVGNLLSIAIERARLYARSVELGAIEERTRLARELHDTVAQGLTATALQLESADALLEAGHDADLRDERVHDAIRRALELTRATLDEVRRSVMDLRAAPLEGQSLAQALRALAKQEPFLHGVRLRVSITGANHPLPQHLESGVYRIVQEAITNIARHAQAQHASVRLVITSQQVRCVIRDDGRGFDPSHPTAERFGLIGINERARLLGGTLRIQSSPGAGAVVELTIPLQAT